jgi:phosphatidylglycerophosphate synthase
MLHFAGAVLALAVPVWGVAALLPPVGAGVGALGSLAAFAIVAGISFIGLRADYPHRSLGLCNVVTLARAALATVLAAPLLTPDLVPRNPQVGWTLLAVALVAFALDGIDGWLARRSGLSSRFGARFDMEVDALLALILALLALQADKAGPWVLLLGAMRYLFIAAGWVLPWLKGPLPDRFSRKVVCVIQIGVLVAMLSPIVQPPVSEGLAVAATLLLIWSFALDIVWLARHRP